MKISTGTITLETSEDWLVDSLLLKKLEDRRELRRSYEEEFGIDQPTEEEKSKIFKIKDWTK